MDRGQQVGTLIGSRPWPEGTDREQPPPDRSAHPRGLMSAIAHDQLSARRRTDRLGIEGDGLLEQVRRLQRERAIHRLSAGEIAEH